MTRTPVILVAALISAGVVFAQDILQFIASFALALEVPGSGPGSALVAFGRVSVGDLLSAAFFGAGLFVSLRFLVPVTGATRWRAVLVRGLVATVIGAVATVIGLTIVGILGSIGPGDHPFGYAFTPTIDTDVFSNWAYLTSNYAVRPLLEWFPIAVLASVFVKLRLGNGLDATDRASASA